MGFIPENAVAVVHCPPLSYRAVERLTIDDRKYLMPTIILAAAAVIADVTCVTGATQRQLSPG